PLPPVAAGAVLAVLRLPWPIAPGCRAARTPLTAWVRSGTARNQAWAESGRPGLMVARALAALDTPSGGTRAKSVASVVQAPAAATPLAPVRATVLRSPRSIGHAAPAPSPGHGAAEILPTEPIVCRRWQSRCQHRSGAHERCELHRRSLTGRSMNP